MKIYEPQEDSELIKKHIAKFARGRTLDMGTGSGILAFTAAKFSKELIAVDINKDAIATLRPSILENMRGYYSNLFSKVSGQFDCILCNAPYLPTEENDSDIALDGGPNGYEWTIEFLRQVKFYLRPTGDLLLLISSLTNPKQIEKELKHLGFSWQIIDETSFDFEQLFVYHITHKDPEQLYYGRRSLVHREISAGRPIAIKQMKPGILSRTAHEANMLQLVNTKEIGPRFIDRIDDTLLMEWVEGERIGDALERATPKDILHILLQILEQCFILDKLGVQKEELTNPYKHILIHNNVPVMIDFERARKMQTPANITQFVQYICSANILRLLEHKGISIEKTQFANLAAKYKKNQTKEMFKELEKKLIRSISSS